MEDARIRVSKLLLWLVHSWVHSWIHAWVHTRVHSWVPVPAVRNASIEHGWIHLLGVGVHHWHSGCKLLSIRVSEWILLHLLLHLFLHFGILLSLLLFKRHFVEIVVQFGEHVA